MYGETDTVAKRDPTIGELVANLDDLRNKRSKHAAELQEIDRAIDEATQNIAKARDYLSESIGQLNATVNGALR